MSIADELAKLEELRRQRVITNEEFDIAKKKVLSDDGDVAKHTPQVGVDSSGEFSTLDLVTGKPDRVDSLDSGRFSLGGETSSALDELAEREIEAEQQSNESSARGHDRPTSHDRDILGEIYSLDRQWDLERDNYKVTGEHGHSYTPTKGGSIFGGVAIVVFGVFWTVMASSMTSGLGGGGLGGGGFSLFPMFGVLFICFGIGVSIWSYNKADEYERAQRRYRKRRRKLESERRKLR